ncbi:MAG TPA: transporter substrate-binding domain-containing protein, partial [Casimicrobiaceae bacterium]|nr:transporter substrate-binding domain-containing protein [Casimicrobiaceae bacterium]
FDNRIAHIIADELHARVEFTWFQPQHGLVRKTLGEGLCDALLGLPQGYEGIAASTPYYRSRYVFVFPRGARTPSFDDPVFLAQRIGVQVIGDDMAATPPAMALAHAHAAHVIGFPVYGEHPAVARMVDAIAKGELDAGVAWGPAAAYFAAQSPRPLAVEPAIASPVLTRFPFEFAMVVAVRKNNQALKDEIDRAIAHRRADIDAVLAAYHVPRTDAPSTLVGSCPAASTC